MSPGPPRPILGHTQTRAMSNVLEYAPPAPLTSRRVLARLALYTLFAATGVVLGAIAGRFIAPTPEYRTSAYLVLESTPTGFPLPTGTRAVKPSEMPATAQSIVRKLDSAAFRQRTADALARAQITASTDLFPGKLAFSSVRDTTLIRIDMTDADPRLAAAIANAAATAATGAAPVKIMSPATSPGAPTTRTRLWVLAGAALGGILFPLACWYATRHERAIAAAEPAVA